MPMTEAQTNRVARLRTAMQNLDPETYQDIRRSYYKIAEELRPLAAALETEMTKQKACVFHGRNNNARYGTLSEHAWHREFADEKEYSRSNGFREDSRPARMIRVCKQSS